MYTEIFKELSNDIGRWGCMSTFNIKVFKELAKKHNVSLGLICKLYQDYIVITEGSGHLWKTPNVLFLTPDEMKNRKKFIRRLLLSGQAMLKESSKDLNYFLIFGKTTNAKILIVQHRYLTSTAFTYCCANNEQVINRLEKINIKLSKKETEYVTSNVIELKKKQVNEHTLPNWCLKFN